MADEFKLEAFDMDKKELVQIPESQFQQAIMSGKFGLRKGTRLPIVASSSDLE